MRVKTIVRSVETSSRGSTKELRRVHKNADPKLHPLERAREYTRAVVAAKMERMFAKPFIGALEEHSDGVYCSALNPVNLASFLTGAGDGEVIVWDLTGQRKLWSVYAHSGFVRGLTVTPDGEYFFSCGTDKHVRRWRMAADEDLVAVEAVAAERRAWASAAADAADGGDEDGDSDEEEGGRTSAARGSGGVASSSSTLAAAAAVAGAGAGRHAVGSRGGRAAGAAGVEPVATWSGKRAFLSIDHHWKDAMFATSGVGVDVWDYDRSTPIHTYAWGADTVNAVRWNPAELGVFASTGSDRSVCLYDIRVDSALRKVTLAMASNAVAWNPREPLNFTVANEDSNLYTFDMRKLSKAMMVHRDHAAAVQDVHYAPTGKEFVSAGYDRTVRLWRVDSGKSRDTYHAKRMQRVFTVRYTMDARFIISGSDDTNVRIWKANASEVLGRTLPQQRAKLDYSKALTKRFAHMPEVERILRHRTLPKALKTARRKTQEERDNIRRKMANIRAHSAPDSTAGVAPPERTRHIVREEK